VTTDAARRAGLAVAGCALLLACAASVAIGTRPTSLRTVLDALVDYDRSIDAHVIVHSLRVPRTFAGLFVGAALGLAGTVMQGMTRNPLADAGILGIEAGAALCVVVAMHWFGMSSAAGYVWFAFFGAAIAAIVVYLLGATGRDGATPVKLALAGAASSTLLASVTAAILLSDQTTLDQFRFWAVGSLAGRDATTVAELAPFIVVGVVLALASGRALNTQSLGDDVARSLGQHVGRARLIGFAAIVLLCGAATAMAGPIAFVGLIIPHVARAIVGSDYRWILAYSLVLAPILLLGSDVVGRVVVRPGELEVGIITALIGAPFFVALVRRRRLAQL
jgi:iron complex transport system permease protein